MVCGNPPAASLRRQPDFHLLQGGDIFEKTVTLMFRLLIGQLVEYTTLLFQRIPHLIG